MQNYFKAVFSDGTVLARSSERAYSHAFLVRGHYEQTDGEMKMWSPAERTRHWSHNSFSRSAELAQRGMRAFVAGMTRSTIALQEVAETVAIDAAEYRRIKETSK
jgi:hypothetical protein